MDESTRIIFHNCRSIALWSPLSSATFHDSEKRADTFMKEAHVNLRTYLFGLWSSKQLIYCAVYIRANLMATPWKTDKMKGGEKDKQKKKFTIMNKEDLERTEKPLSSSNDEIEKKEKKATPYGKVSLIDHIRLPRYDAF